MLPLLAGREASSGVGAPPYARHRPERTVLYQLVEQYYPALKAHLASEGRRDLPAYVEQEFEEYLKCGRLEHGFLRVRCDSCHAEHLLADEVFPEQPVRQWVLSVPYPLRFLFASRAAIMGRVLGIVYRCIATHLIKEAGFSSKTAQAGAVTLIQRFGNPLNPHLHFHMLFLDGVYVERPGGSLRFRWVKAPSGAELTRLAHTIAQRPARRAFSGAPRAAGAGRGLLGSSITYRIAVGPRAGRKVFTLQTLPACDPEEAFADTVGKVAGFSLHAGVAARTDERKKLERLCGCFRT